MVFTTRTTACWHLVLLLLEAAIILKFTDAFQHVRLVGGGTRLEGQVLVHHNAMWGAVCGHEWSFSDARVVCRQLGFPDALNANGNHCNDTYRNRKILMDDVECDGSETRLQDCKFDGWERFDCDYKELAYVECDPVGSLIRESTLRLVDRRARSPYEGRLELFHDSFWWFFCDYGWTTANADVACRQLGFPGSTAIALESDGGRQSTFKPSQRDYGRFWSHHIRCRGNEGRIEECPKEGWSPDDYQCVVNFHIEGLTCQAPTVRLNRAAGKISEGIVEVFHDGQWGTVCDANWTAADAGVVCRQLNYKNALESPQTNTSQSSIQTVVWVSEVKCNGAERRLENCSSSPWKNGAFCHRKNIATVLCGNNRAADTVLARPTERVVENSTSQSTKLTATTISLSPTLRTKTMSRNRTSTSPTSQPERVSPTSQPERTTLTSQPERTNFTSQPERTNLTSQPERTTLTSQPERTTLTSQPERTTLTSQPERTTLTSQPKRTTLTSQPERTNLTSQPERTTLTSRPNRVTPTSQSERTNLTSQPKRTTLTSQPERTTLTSRPKRVTPTSQSERTAYVYTQSQSTSLTKTEKTRHFLVVVIAVACVAIVVVVSVSLFFISKHRRRPDRQQRERENSMSATLRENETKSERCSDYVSMNFMASSLNKSGCSQGKNCNQVKLAAGESSPNSFPSAENMVTPYAITPLTFPSVAGQSGKTENTEDSKSQVNNTSE